jgi:hypothetical protein
VSDGREAAASVRTGVCTHPVATPWLVFALILAMAEQCRCEWAQSVAVAWLPIVCTSMFCVHCHLRKRVRSVIV